MFLVADDELYYFRDASGLVRGAVYIEHCYRVGEFFGRQLVQFNIFAVDEEASSAAVYQRTNPLLPLSFRAFNFYPKVQGVQTRFCCADL